MTEADSVAAPIRAAATAATSRARVRYHRVMRIVRRAHLYAGLFMTPWVFLYGVSALLFNHPDAFPDQALTSFVAGDGRGPGSAAFQPPRAAEVAGRVVEALNRAAPKPKAGAPEPAAGDAYRLVRPDEAQFNRDLFAFARADGKDYNFRVNLLDGAGTIREVTRVVSTPPPFVSRAGVKLSPSPFEPVATRLGDVLKARGVSAGAVTVRLAPDLTFLMEGRGRTWRVTYHGQNGQVSGRPAESRGVGPTLRRYLILLHVAHGFPSRVNTRWVWAIIVDAMFVSMVGWGITGLLMWWQMKNVRRAGLVVLIASLVTAAVLALGMHAAFLAEGLT